MYKIPSPVSIIQSFIEKVDLCMWVYVYHAVHSTQLLCWLIKRQCEMSCLCVCVWKFPFSLMLHYTEVEPYTQYIPEWAVFGSDTLVESCWEFHED